MAKKTYWEMFVDVVDQVWLTNTFDDWTTETRRIKRDINQIQKQVLSLSKTYLKKAWITISGWTVADQANYTIPVTVDKITNIQITSSSILYFPEHISISQFHRLANTNSSSDIPIFFTIDKNELFIYPTPVSNSLPIELNAWQIATDLDTDPSATTDQTTDLQIKEWYENVIYYYVLTEAFSRLEDFASWDRYDKKFDKIDLKYRNEVKNSTNSVVLKKWWTRFVDPNYYNTLTN